MATDSDRNDNVGATEGTRENLDSPSSESLDRGIATEEAIDRLESSLDGADGLEEEIEHPRLHPVPGADSDGIIHPVDTHVKDKTKIP